jgi:hypothetical protein
MLDPIKEPAHPGRELERRDPEARDGAVTPAAAANPPDGTRIPPPGCSFNGPTRIQGRAVSPRADLPAKLRGAFR